MDLTSSTFEGVHGALYPTADNLKDVLPQENMTVDGSGLTGLGATVVASQEHTEENMNSLYRKSLEGSMIKTPFVMAYGGTGGITMGEGRGSAYGHARQEPAEGRDGIF